MIEFVTFCLVFPAGIVIGSIFHECGHWAMAAALGFEPRIVCLGHGRQIAQLRALGVSIVLRARPIGGHVMMVPVGRDRRNAVAAFTAAGVAANCLALLASLAAFQAWGGADTVVDTAMLAFAGSQAVGVLVFLLSEVEGKPGLTDREKLIAWATGRDEDLLENAYAPLVARYRPERRPARTPDFAEVLFYAVLGHRNETWGRRHAIRGLEAVLARGRLNQAEHIWAQKQLMGFLQGELDHLAKGGAPESGQSADVPSA